MKCMFYAYSKSISRTGRFVARNSFCQFSRPSWRRIFEHAAIRTLNLEPPLTRFHRVHSYSQTASRVTSRSRKSNPKAVMEEEKNAFFVVRKGDIVGVYNNLSDCQAQAGSSICDPPVSVYKGYAMAQDTKDCLISRGLKNALYSIRAADLTEELFGTLTPCPFQQPPLSEGEPSTKDLPVKRLPEWLESETGEAAELIADTPLRKQMKLDHNVEAQFLAYGQSCIIEFDGASKGNPGQAGAGVVMRADDGSLICKLREGLGVRTNNAAEYRAMILGLRYALEKGFTRIRVLGDSKLVCMQIQGLWKVKNQNMSNLCEEAKILKDKFHSFQIAHVLRGLNSEADAQANLAVHLAEGQVQEELEK
ncbi:hypothetical protein LguiA_032717 [Lonicera macranthoides]